MRYLYKAITVPLKMMLAYLTMLSFRDQKTYIFGAWDGNKFADNPKYLFLQALKDPSLRPIWVTKDQQVYDKLKNLNLPVHKCHSMKGWYYQLTAGACFMCSHPGDVFIYLFGSALQINLWHGVSLKKVVFDDLISGMLSKNKFESILFNIRHKIYTIPFSREYVVSTSSSMTNIYKGAFRKETDKILELGQPRNDVFFDDSLEIDPFPFKGKYNKIILYMPTHRNSGAIEIDLNKIFNLKELNEYLVDKNYLLLVNKHYYHANESQSDLMAYPNIIDITTEKYDSQILLKYADILISDYSSCYIDYLLLDRPIIFYNYDLEWYLAHDRELYFPYEEVTPGPKVSTYSELLIELQKSDNGKGDLYQEMRKTTRDLFYSHENQKITGPQFLEHVNTKILNKK